MGKKRIFNPLQPTNLIDGRPRLIDEYGPTAVKIYKYNINVLGIDPKTVLEQHKKIIYKNGKFIKLKMTPVSYVNKKILPQIQTGYNSSDVTVPIKVQKLNGDLNYLLSKIPRTDTHWAYIQTSSGKIFALNDATIKKLATMGEPDFVFTDVYKSGEELLTEINELGDFDLRITKRINPIIDGAFFKYTHKLFTDKTKINLERYGVYTEVKSENYDLNCLCRCFETAKYDLTKIKQFVKNQAIPMRNLKKVAAKMEIYITVKRLVYDSSKKSLLKSTTTKYGNKTHRLLELGLLDGHYFLIEKTNYTSYSIKNFEAVRHHENFNSIYKKGQYGYERDKNRYISSYDIIVLLLSDKDKYLCEIENSIELFKTTHHDKINNTEIFNDLSYNDNIQNLDYNSGEIIEGDLKYNKPLHKSENRISDTYYFDFETTTSSLKKYDLIKNNENPNHKPYCVYSDKNPSGFFGVNCGKLFLNYLACRHGIVIPKRTKPDCETNEGKSYDVYGNEVDLSKPPIIQLIAHNASYDFRFIQKYLDRINILEKGNSLLKATGCYYHKSGGINLVIYLDIKCSYKMINMPLSKFGRSFNLEVSKEIMPYDLYTEENVELKLVDVEECYQAVIKAGLDLEVYKSNCKRWGCYEKEYSQPDAVTGKQTSKRKINILKYAGEYCYLDCLTLKAGYEKFKSMTLEALDLNINDYITLASMSNDYLVLKGCYDDVLQISGIPRAFIQKCVVGGRTMCADNEKHHVTDRLSDFDGVSLYPSAMNRMNGFLKGKPKIITCFEKHNEWDGYFVCIKVTKVGKHYQFPLGSQMEDTVRMFSNNLEGKILYLDKTSLDDLVNFQKVEYEFINGYYYDEGFNPKVKDVIKHVFESRLKYKKEKNPIQMIFKELMNSSYGKSFMKPIQQETHYILKDSFDKFLDRNFNYLIESILVANGKYYKATTIKPIDEHFNNVHVGVSILSESKRIMNEVMCLAEDLEIPMYYTDTDSIHIQADKISELAVEFKKNYQRELIGNQLGQFHTDFDLDDSVGEIVSVESYFVGKKAYIDKLEGFDKDGCLLNNYHIRMKGVPTNCISYKATHSDKYNDVMDIYKDLYDGNSINFDLLAGGVMFESQPNGEIFTRTSFNRNIKY